ALPKKFASLDEAVVHEMALTKQRRATWTNLIKGETKAVKDHVTADGNDGGKKVIDRGAAADVGEE
ncbi:MAG: hypothetical protein VYC42_04880, partial [Pseudomonadota bacterium]|nr:hypothetical protein [Pseudomonadota bacterium]